MRVKLLVIDTLWEFALIRIIPFLLRYESEKLVKDTVPFPQSHTRMYVTNKGLQLKILKCTHHTPLCCKDLEQDTRPELHPILDHRSCLEF